MNLLILNLCLFCIGTVGVSKTAEIVNSLRVFKDAADRGYKLKQATRVEINITDDDEDVQLRKLARWIPIVNILHSYNDIIDYNNNTDVIFDALSSMDLIEEMTEKEKEIYKDKPTILNAILTPIKASHRQKYINIDGPMAEELLKEIPDTEENKEIIELLNNIKEDNSDRKDPPKKLFKRKK